MGQALKEISIDNNYVKSIHESSKGWITKAEIKDSSFNQWHYKYNDLIELNFKGENIYISLNTFFKPSRRIECIKELKANFIDLDIYNTGFSKEQILMNLEENYFNRSIPRPSFILDSGRGLYLVWLINSVPSQALPLWKAVEEYFYNELKEFGADRMSLDAARILRVPESINSKSNSKVRVIEQYEYTYDLREIQNNFLPELQPTVKKKGRPKKVVFIHRVRSLYYARIQDLIKLCELREYNLKGHREIILFLYRYYLCSFTDDVEKALNDVLELNSEFICPLSKNEVVRATKSAETCYLSKDKQYKYKNETLIELLEISDSEQMEMKTIISKTESKRRNNNYNKNKYQEQLKVKGKLTKKDEINIQRSKIKDLLQQGLKQKEISKQLDIPIRTIERRVKELRTLREIL